jgi:hypothetical protein
VPVNLGIFLMEKNVRNKRTKGKGTVEYRGIQLHESVKLYMKNGELNKRIIKSLNKIADLLMTENDILLSEYKSDKSKILIDFNCEHEPHWIAPYSYKQENRCSACAGNSPEESKKNFYKLIEEANFKAITEYKKTGIKVKIQCDKGHIFNTTPNSFIHQNARCSKCSNKCPEQARQNFEKRIKENGHILLSPYKRALEKVLIDFRCGHKPHRTKPAVYMQRTNCPKCMKNDPEQAEEDFRQKVEKNGHIQLTSYKKAIEKVLIDFQCGHEPHWITPNMYKEGNGCPECGTLNMVEKRTKKSKKQFILLVKSKGHLLLSEFKNTHTKVLIDYKCGHEPRWVAPYDYKEREVCPKCNQRCSEQVKEEFFLLINKNKHEVLSGYKNNRKKILIDFKCGHKPRWISPKDYKNKGGCLKCNKRCPEQAKEEFLKKIKFNGHILLSEYKNSNSKVLINFCCGHLPNKLRPIDYKNGVGCPICKDSKGVKFICEWLIKNKINYEVEVKLPYKNKRYDIYIPSENLIVEVHGSQHYYENDFFQRTLEEEQENDCQKRKYAELLGYEYIEVDYREHIPELALERFLDQFLRIRKGSPSIKHKYEQLSLF